MPAPATDKAAAAADSAAVVEEKRRGEALEAAEMGGVGG